MIGGYIHHFDQLAERTLGELIATFQAGGITEARYKTHQAQTWIGRWDGGGAADITGIAELRRVHETFEAAGIRSYPWCVPMGLDVEGEAHFAAAVARVTGRLDFDLEPYEEFWPAVARGDVSAVGPFFRRVRELVGPSVELTLDFPARNSAWEWGKVKPAVAAAAPYVDRFALQSYFGLSQAKDAEWRVRQVLGSGNKPIDHIIDTDPIGEFGELLEWLSGERAEHCLIWRATDMSPRAYEVLKRYRFPGGGPVPMPTPIPAPMRWEGVGFERLAAQLGATVVGEPGGAAYPDGQGNVRQAGARGLALWVKQENRNYWSPA